MIFIILYYVYFIGKLIYFNKLFKNVLLIIYLAVK